MSNKLQQICNISIGPPGYVKMIIYPIFRLRCFKNYITYFDKTKQLNQYYISLKKTQMNSFNISYEI